MIITTTEQVEGKHIVRTVGLVKGSTIRARHLGRDIVAQLRGAVGGEISEYTMMMAESRQQAIERMIEDAEKQGANAIVGVRFTTSMVMSGSAEMMLSLMKTLLLNIFSNIYCSAIRGIKSGSCMVPQVLLDYYRVG